MRDLVAALEQIRRRLLRVIGALEDGNQEAALAELETAEAEWRTAIEEFRA